MGDSLHILRIALFAVVVLATALMTVRWWAALKYIGATGEIHHFYYGVVAALFGSARLAFGHDLPAIAVAACVVLISLGGWWMLDDMRQHVAQAVDVSKGRAPTYYSFWYKWNMHASTHRGNYVALALFVVIMAALTFYPARYQSPPAPVQTAAERAAEDSAAAREAVATEHARQAAVAAATAHAASEAAKAASKPAEARARAAHAGVGIQGTTATTAHGTSTLDPAVAELIAAQAGLLHADSITIATLDTEITTLHAQRVADSTAHAKTVALWQTRVGNLDKQNTRLSESLRIAQEHAQHPCGAWWKPCNVRPVGLVAGAGETVGLDGASQRFFVGVGARY